MAMPRFWHRLLLVALSLVHTVVAISLTNADFNIAVGVPFTITWINAQGPVSIDLLGGEDPNQPLPVVLTIATNLSANSFTWTPGPVPQPVQNVYGLRVYDNVPNSPEAYSYAFQILNAPSSASTLVTSTRPATSSASSAVSRTSTSTKTSVPPSASATSSTAPIPLIPSADATPLSTGAKAGIGIGAAAAFITLMTWAFFRMRRAQREDAAAAAKRGLELGKQPEKPGGPPGAGPGGPGGPGGMKAGMGMGMGGGPPSQDGRGTPFMGGRDTPGSSHGGRETPGIYGPPGGSPLRGRPGHQSTYSVASTVAGSRHYSMSSVAGQLPARQTPEPWRTPR